MDSSVLWGRNCMKKRRNLKDLTIRDNFMFAAVMTEAPDICREVLEYALGIMAQLSRQKFDIFIMN